MPLWPFPTDVRFTATLPPLLPPSTLAQARPQPRSPAGVEARQNDNDKTQNDTTANPQTSPVAPGIQACQRCRQQKLRCTREFPSCKRCQRASTLCVYPPPPDRKRLAAQRIRKSRFRPYIEPKTSSARVERAEQLGKAPEHAEERSSPATEVHCDRVSRLDTAREDDTRDRSPWITPPVLPSYGGPVNQPPRLTPVPSLEVARLLIEMYFTRVYNATLLFHKEAFLADYAANKLPDFLTHAVFALASIFLPAPSRDSRIDDRETDLGISALSTSEFRTFAHEWATAATQQVLVQAMEPSLQNIQACQVLTLYWFSKDARDQVHILSSLAYTSCRLMGFHIARDEDMDDDELAAEMKRRCLWSSWMTACISQENASFKSESWSEVVGLPFPADAVSLASGKPELIEAFDENGRIVPQNQSNRSKRVSIMGELVKLFSLWWQIQRFVRSHQDKLSGDSASRLQEFLRLDRQLEQFSETLHADLKYSGPSSFNSKVDPYTLFSMQCIYRLCACALHSSIVPLFSSTSPDPEISKKLVRMCAEEAVKQSMIILDMASAFLNTRPDISRLSSMTGYTMFVASAIQIRSLGAQGKLKTYSGHLKAAVTILRNLNEYWSPLRSLWIKLVVVSSFAGMDLDNFSVSREEYQTPATAIPTNIEQIVSPEAVSESDPGTDIYTYVGRSEPGVMSQHSSPARIGSHSATGPIRPPPNDNGRTRVVMQTEREERFATDQSQTGIDRLLQADFAPDTPFSFANSSPEKIAKQRHLQVSLDRDLSDGNSHHSRDAEVVDLYMAEINPQPQLYSPSMSRQLMLSQQSDALRPMMNSFDTTNGMMGMGFGMDMDLGSEEDDFWWTRSWGSVRIL